MARLLSPGCPPFALLRRNAPGRDEDVVEVLTGPVEHVERLADIPLGEGPAADGRPVTDALALIPFRQIRERGFDVRDDGTPLAVLRPEHTLELPLPALLDALPRHPVRVGNGSFDVTDDAYAEIVERVVRDEIGRGEGANFVIRRTFRGEIPGYGPADALALFRRLLAGERGAYWTYAVHTGERTLVGASPEAHVRMSGGTVVMNPISGTYRYPPGGPDAEGLLRFLHDRKEVEELSMVVDEELKMMCTVGDRGGAVIGPRLKEMAHLAHTEYELRGRSSLDVRDVLRETMFAATVTGSPVQNACRVIERYEPVSPHDTDGRGRATTRARSRSSDGTRAARRPWTPHPHPDRRHRARRPAAGAGRRHPRPPLRPAERGRRDARQGGRRPRRAGRAPAPDRPGAAAPPRLADDPRVRAALDARRAGLAPFWLRMRTAEEGTGADAPHGPALAGLHALVVDGEDTFTAMLAHLLRSTGLAVTVRRYDEPGLREAALSHRGPVVLGPGPGNPADTADPKMRLLRALAADLVRDHRHGLLGVCLGHELLAAELGLEIARKDVPYQGAQERIDFFGRRETVGFYNTFTARCEEAAERELALHGVELSRDPATGDVHALRGPGFAGVQFHPESVLTLDGTSLVAGLLAAVRV